MTDKSNKKGSAVAGRPWAKVIAAVKNTGASDIAAEADKYLIRRALFDAGDRFGATIAALSVVGGALQPAGISMEPVVAGVGFVMGAAMTWAFGYAKSLEERALTITYEVHGHDLTGKTRVEP